MVRSAHPTATEIFSIIKPDSYIKAWNWNWKQHIPIRYSFQEVAALQARIAELEQSLRDNQTQVRSG